MDLGIFLGTLAGLVHIIAYITYNHRILKDKFGPNNTTWTLLMFLALLNSSSYLKMSQDVVKSILPIISAIFRFITFSLIIAKGKWKKLDKAEYTVLIIGIIAGIMWYILKNATYANLLLQLAYLIAIFPTYRSIWKNKSKESFTPWFLWGCGHSLGIATVLSRWSGQYQDLAFSSVGAIVHFIAAFLTLRKSNHHQTKYFLKN